MLTSTDISIDLITFLQLVIIIPGGAVIWFLINKITKLESRLEYYVKTKDMEQYVTLSQQALNIMLNRILSELDSIRRRLEEKDDK